MRSAEDVEKFYALYHPEFPAPLAKAIGIRVQSIVEKSRKGEALTEEDAGYIERSKQPSKTWDPLEDLQREELAGKILLAMKRLDELATE